MVGLGSGCFVSATDCNHLFFITLKCSSTSVIEQTLNHLALVRPWQGVLAAETFQFISMKKFILAACAAFVGLTMSAQENTQVIKHNPLGWFGAQYQLGYERAINDNISASLSAGFIGGTGEVTVTDENGENETITSSTKSGFIFLPEVRYYTGGNACEGFYFGLGGRFRSATTVDENDALLLERTANGAHLVVGWQQTRGDGFMVDYFFGPQYKTVTNVGSLEEAANFFKNDNPIGLRLGVNIGFGW